MQHCCDDVGDCCGASAGNFGGACPIIGRKEKPTALCSVLFSEPTIAFVIVRPKGTNNAFNNRYVILVDFPVCFMPVFRYTRLGQNCNLVFLPYEIDYAECDQFGSSAGGKPSEYDNVQN